MAQQVEVTLVGEAPDGDRDELMEQTVLVTPLGSGRYRLEAVPIFTEAAKYGDVIEAAPGPDGALRFRRVVEPSGLREFSYALPQRVVKSAPFGAFLTQITAHGGHWERLMGGLFFAYLPGDTRFDLPRALEAVLAAVGPGAPRHPEAG